jgi:hypothetical protein
MAGKSAKILAKKMAGKFMADILRSEIHTNSYLGMFADSTLVAYSLRYF